jgi:formate hydrogenlyase subunit 3/multisubunit Na+/H+ antiporter MnhD subunit
VWLLPLVAGLLPAIATIVAFLISVRFGQIPACNPFFDGCVSISRAARHDLPNHLFRALVLPGATLQAMTWLLCAQWLRSIDPVGADPPKGLAALGVLAGIFFVVYGAFLGTEGEVYQWLRRYGINFYFGFTYLCMLLTSARVFRLSQGGWVRVPWHVDRVLGVFCLLILAFGLTNLFSKALLPDEEMVDQIENSLEWFASSIFTLFFVILAWLWGRTRFRLRAGSESG